MEYTLEIRGPIGGWWGISSQQVIDCLNKNKGKRVDVAISSPGGFVDVALEIYQAFRDHGDVHAHIISMTASAATIIAMGAKTVDMVPSSLMLIHNASIGFCKWESANKERLDKIIQEIQKSRDDLKTIDEVLANIYVERTGKTKEEVEKKMQKAAWLSADDALDFGLIDSIRDDAEGEETNVQNSKFSNSILQGFGLPAIPTSNGETINFEESEDGADGNPTDGIVKKTLNAIKGLLSPSANNKTINSMKKVFQNICSLLGVQDLECTDDAVSMKIEDVQKVEDRIAELSQQITDANAAKDELQKQLDTANASITEKDAEIENLKKAPGDKVDDAPEEETVTDHMKAGRELYNLVKNI